LFGAGVGFTGAVPFLGAKKERISGMIRTLHSFAERLR
jgi:hypothetical protein